MEILSKTGFQRDMTYQTAPDQQANEPHMGGVAQRLNWLRAGVLGANDGIVSVAAIAVGVAGATTATAPILTAASFTAIFGAPEVLPLDERPLGGRRTPSRIRP